jgi:hypothetical protein
VLLFGKELASFASLDEIFGVGDGCWQVKPRLVRFTDQVGGCRVTATFAAVDFS